MKRKIIKITLLSLLSLLIVSSCSESDDEYSETSKLEEKQHGFAQEGVEMIKTPIEKAQKAQGISDIRNQKIGEEIESQQ